MIKKCAVCGKEFKANYGNCKICSDECRAVRNKKLQKQWYLENYKYSSTFPRGHNCQFCGKEVKPIKAIRIIRRKFHDECLIKAAYEEIQMGGKMGTSKILKYAANKGFTKAEILEYMEELQNDR